MRYLLIASLVLMVAGVASAATPGVVPDSTLAAMGISGMQPMSDVQGMDVRGMGFTTAKTVAAFTVTKGSTTVTGFVSSSAATTGSGTPVAVAVGVYPVSIDLFHGAIRLNNAVVVVGVAVGK